LDKRQVVSLEIYNEDIRGIVANARKKGIRMYHIAYFIGVTESTLSRYFRKPMKEDIKNKIVNAIYSLGKSIEQKN
jgi:predicted transcriptional regulator